VCLARMAALTASWVTLAGILVAGGKDDDGDPLAAPARAVAANSAPTSVIRLAKPASYSVLSPAAAASSGGSVGPDGSQARRDSVANEPGPTDVPRLIQLARRMKAWKALVST